MSSQSHEIGLLPPTGPSAQAALSAGATSNPTQDDDANDPRHRVQAARARLMHRLHEVERRVNQTKDTLNLANHIRAQPVAAVGVSLVVGATVGFLRGGRAHSAWGSELFTVIRNVAMDVAKTQLRGWAAQHLGGSTDANTATAAAKPTAASAPGQ